MSSSRRQATGGRSGNANGRGSGRFEARTEAAKICKIDKIKKDEKKRKKKDGLAAGPGILGLRDWEWERATGLLPGCLDLAVAQLGYFDSPGGEGWRTDRPTGRDFPLASFRLTRTGDLLAAGHWSSCARRG